MNKKILIPIIILIILLATTITIYFITQNSAKPQDTLTTYISLLNDHKYEEMYNLLSSDSKSKTTQENFIKRNKNIYEGIDACNIKVEINEITKGIHILKKEIRAKIIREFAKKHKRIMLKFLDDDNEFAMKWCEYEVNTDNLVKEMTEEFE